MSERSTDPSLHPASTSERAEPGRLELDETVVTIEPGSEQTIEVAGSSHILRVGGRTSRRAARPTFRPPTYEAGGVSPGYLPMAKKSRRRNSERPVVAANGYRLVTDHQVQRSDLPSTLVPEALAPEVTQALRDARHASADPDWLPPDSELQDADTETPRRAAPDDEQVAQGFWERLNRNSAPPSQSPHTARPQALAASSENAGHRTETLADHQESDAELADEIMALDPAVRQSLVRKHPMEVRVRDFSIKKSQREFLIQDVSFNLKPGELSAVVDRGDDTWSRVVGALCGRHEFSGSVHLDGWELSQQTAPALRTSFVWVSTNPNYSCESATSVTDHLWEIVQLRHAGKSGASRRGLWAAVLASLPLEDCADKPLDSLTVVEQHWVALAEVVASQAPIVVWDGFGRGLTAYQVRALVEMVRNFAQDGLWTVMLQNPDSAAMMRCERVVVLSDHGSAGRGAEVCFHGPARSLCRFFDLDHAEKLPQVLGSDVDWPKRWRSSEGSRLTEGLASLQFSGKGVRTRWASRRRQYRIASRSAVGSHLRYAESLWALSLPLVLCWLACAWWFGSGNLAWGSTSAANFVSAAPVGLSVLVVLAAAFFAKPPHMAFGQWATGRSALSYVLGVQSVLYGALLLMSVLFAAVFAKQGGPSTGLFTPWRAAETLAVCMCAGLAVFGVASLLLRTIQKPTSMLAVMLALLGWLTLTCGGLVDLSGRFSRQIVSVDNLTAVVAWTSPTWLASSALGASHQVLHRQPGCAENLSGGCRSAWAYHPENAWLPLIVLAGIALGCALVWVAVAYRSVTKPQPAKGTRVVRSGRAHVANRDSAGYYIRLVASMVWFAGLVAVAVCLLLDAFGFFGVISHVDQQVPGVREPTVVKPDDAPIA